MRVIWAWAVKIPDRSTDANNEIFCIFIFVGAYHLHKSRQFQRNFFERWETRLKSTFGGACVVLCPFVFLHCKLFVIIEILWHDLECFGRVAC